MRAALLSLVALLALAAPASAGDDLVSILLEHASGTAACVGAAAQASVGIGINPSQDPPVQVTAPPLVPPSPSCLPSVP